jgi:predicted Abi (CAAX) family protease
VLHLIVQRIARACATLPRPRDGLELLLAAIVMATLGASARTGLLHWSPQPAPDLAVLAVRALFIPALGEELVFRAALMPGRHEGARPLPWIALSVVLFTAWHVMESTFLPGAAAAFLRADFLALAAVLGLLCALLRWRSGSIWTAVALHWLVVVAWQGWFGGPRFGAPS